MITQALRPATSEGSEESEDFGEGMAQIFMTFKIFQIFRVAGRSAWVTTHPWIPRYADSPAFTGGVAEG